MDSFIFNEEMKRFEPRDKNCIFCVKGKSEGMEYNKFISIYQIKDRTNLVVYRNVKYNEAKIGLLRCANCEKVHTRISTISWLMVVIGVISIFILPIWLSIVFNLGKAGLILLMILVFGLVVYITKAIEKYLIYINGVLTVKEGAVRSKLVQEFLRQGWRLEKPVA